MQDLWPDDVHGDGDAAGVSLGTDATGTIEDDDPIVAAWRRTPRA